MEVVRNVPKSISYYLNGPLLFSISEFRPILLRGEMAKTYTLFSKK